MQPGTTVTDKEQTRVARRNILIVDDEPDLRNTLKDLLEIYGYSVITASNGKEALDLLKTTEAPCLMLLDLMMPIMNGWEVLQTLKQEHQAILGSMPIVVISAAADVSGIEENFGCELMRKPLNMQKLTSLASRYCSV